MSTGECKPFKTLDEQINILKDRGLTIMNEEQAKAFLLNNNYYRVSGYSLTLRNHDVFYSTATFENIIEIYEFDREFRHLLLQYIEIVEVKTKSIYTYEFTQKYGGLGYLDSSYFCNEEIYGSIITKSKDQLGKGLRHEAFLKHHVEDLKKPIPMWAYVELFTISDISCLFKISEDEIKKKVAQHFGLMHETAGKTMERYLHGMTILRNLCAHGSRLYNRPFVTKASLNREEQAWLRKDPSGNPDNSRLFGHILCIRRLLTKEQFEKFKEGLSALNQKYPFVEMRFYGFCDDWENLLC